MKALVIIATNFEELEAIGTIDILKRANFIVDIYSLDYKDKVKGRSSINIDTLSNFNSLTREELETYDLLFIPGGAHYIALEESLKFKEIIKYFNNNKKYIAAICAAPTILGHLGILQNKRYTCYKSMNEDFKGIFKDTPVVKDDNIISGMSLMSVIDFSFLILEQFLDKKEIDKIKESIYYKEHK